MLPGGNQRSWISGVILYKTNKNPSKPALFGEYVQTHNRFGKADAMPRHKNRSIVCMPLAPLQLQPDGSQPTALQFRRGLLAELTAPRLNFVAQALAKSLRLNFVAQALAKALAKGCSSLGRLVVQA